MRPFGELSTSAKCPDGLMQRKSCALSSRARYPDPLLLLAEVNRAETISERAAIVSMVTFLVNWGYPREHPPKRNRCLFQCVSNRTPLLACFS